MGIVALHGRDGLAVPVERELRARFCFRLHTGTSETRPEVAFHLRHRTVRGWLIADGVCLIVCAALLNVASFLAFA